LGALDFSGPIKRQGEVGVSMEDTLSELRRR
jgi:hypothetical protein